MLKKLLAVVVVCVIASCAGAAKGAVDATAASSTAWTSDYEWLDNASLGYQGFQHDATGAPGDWKFATNLGGEPGLWIVPTGGRYEPGTAEWTYTAPGTTRVTSVEADIAYRNRFLPSTCLTVGLRAGTHVVDRDRRCGTSLLPGEKRGYHVSLEADPSADASTLYVELSLACPGGAEKSCPRSLAALDPLHNGAFARVTTVKMSLADSDQPTVAASGTLPTLDGITVRNDETFDLRAAVGDGGSGIRRVWLERNGTTVASQDASCDPSHNTPELGSAICSAQAALVTSVDTSTLPEGTYVYVVKAEDYAGNVGSSPNWAFTIDRSPTGAQGADDQGAASLDQSEPVADDTVFAGAAPVPVSPTGSLAPGSYETATVEAGLSGSEGGLEAPVNRTDDTLAVSGVVVDDATGDAVAGAAVSFTTASGITLTTSSDSKGGFAFVDVPDASSYGLGVTAPGYGSYTVTGDSLAVGDYYIYAIDLTSQPQVFDHSQPSPPSDASELPSPALTMGPNAETAGGPLSPPYRSEAYTPPSIPVHVDIQGPGCSLGTSTNDFREIYWPSYILHVVGPEIGSKYWPGPNGPEPFHGSALEANMAAIQAFSWSHDLNRAANGAAVNNTTQYQCYDPSYSLSGRHWLAPLQQILDHRIVDAHGQIWDAQYKGDLHCPGACPHYVCHDPAYPPDGNQLNQIGAKALQDKCGYTDWTKIVEYYYTAHVADTEHDRIPVATVTWDGVPAGTLHFVYRDNIGGAPVAWRYQLAVKKADGLHIVDTTQWSPKLKRIRNDSDIQPASDACLHYQVRAGYPGGHWSKFTDVVDPTDPTATCFAPKGRTTSGGGPSCNPTGDSPGPAGGPANDNFSSAAELGGDSGSVTGTLVGATLQPGENGSGTPAERDGATASVWYCFVPSSSGSYTFTTEGSEALGPDAMEYNWSASDPNSGQFSPPMMSVYGNPDGSGTLPWHMVTDGFSGGYTDSSGNWTSYFVAYPNNWNGDSLSTDMQSELGWTYQTVDLQAGRQYLVELDNSSWSGAVPTGPFKLSWGPTQPSAPNDDADNDGVPDSTDNCPNTWNPGQANTYTGDLPDLGDACSPQPDMQLTVPLSTEGAIPFQPVHNFQVDAGSQIGLGFDPDSTGYYRQNGYLVAIEPGSYEITVSATVSGSSIASGEGLAVTPASFVTPYYAHAGVPQNGGAGTYTDTETITLTDNDVRQIGTVNGNPVYGIYLGIAYTGINGNGSGVSGAVEIKQLQASR